MLLVLVTMQGMDIGKITDSEKIISDLKIMFLYLASYFSKFLFRVI
jgi:hypothetical protein